MPSKSKRLIRVAPKSRGQDHSDPTEKILIRKAIYAKLRDWIGRDPRILDVFCGDGLMWRAAYGRTRDYLGVDLKQFLDDRATIRCDNRRLLRHVDFDANNYDLIDIDAYGSPFEAFALLANRINWQDKGAIGVILTDGTGVNSKLNRLPSGFLHFVGYAPRYGEQMEGLWLRMRESLQQRALARCLALAKARIIYHTGTKNTPGRDGRTIYTGLILGPAKE